MSNSQSKELTALRVRNIGGNNTYKIFHFFYSHNGTVFVLYYIKSEAPINLFLIKS